MINGGSIARWEIASREADAIRAFYTGLFGWRTEGNLVRCGQGIGGWLFEPGEGLPSFVTVYVAVDDLEGTLEEVERLGGSTYVPPTASPVPNEMAFAVFGDPDGNIVGLATPSPIAVQVHPNGTRSGRPVVWFEVSVGDRQRACGFYGELFGWGFRPFEGYDPEYVIIETGIGSIGGGFTRPGGEAQAIALYVGVDELAATIERASSLGARVEQEPTVISASAGSFALLRDPAGFRFGIWSG